MLTSDGENRDPRLDPLDLRGALREWRIRLSDIEGAVLPGLKVTLAPRGEPDSFAQAHSDKEGRLTAVLPKRVDALHLFVAGRGSAKVLWSADEQVIALGEAPKLRFRAISPSPLPPDLEVSVTLGTNRGDAPDPLRTAAAALTPQFTRAVVGQELVHDAVWPGRYAFHWQMRSKLSGDILEIAAVPIEIGSEPPADPIEIAPPAADLEKAIAEMQRRAGR